MAKQRSNSALGFHLYGGGGLVAVGLSFYDWRAGVIYGGLFLLWLAHKWVR